MYADEFWFSIALGVGLGVAYVAASYFSNKRALRSKQNPMLVVVATMMVRIFVALVVLVGVIVLLPVTPTALMGSFFVIFVAGMTAEIWLLHRRGSARTDPPS